MNFTRDPIIETVITPREGCKLLIRSSKASAQEEYLVDAVEVVSFGHSFFYRSTERPKSFLVPITDYEIVETKEAKLTLKKASSERLIKIGGGKDSSKGKTEDSTEEKKPKRRRSRKSKSRTETPAPELGTDEPKLQENQVAKDVKAPSFISKLFPPPTTLIKETLGRYKPEDPAPEDLFQIEESETSSEPDLGKIEDETSPEKEKKSEEE